MRGLEDPFNYAVIDPGSWKDSIKTPIYTLLDGLREAVHGYSATERHPETDHLLKNGAEAVVKILEDTVEHFKPGRVPSVEELGVDLRIMWHNAGDRWRTVNSRSLGRPGPQFVQHFKDKLGRWDERYGSVSTVAPIRPTYIEVQPGDIAPLTFGVVDDSSQAQRTYDYQLDQEYLGYMLTQDNSYAPSSVITARDPSFFSVPIGSCVVPATSGSDGLGPAPIKFRGINTLPTPLQEEMKLMKEFLEKYHMASEDHVGCGCLTCVLPTQEVGGLVLLSPQRTSIESTLGFSNPAARPSYSCL